MKALLLSAVVLAGCTSEGSSDSCEERKVACGGRWLVGTNCEEPMRRECIEMAESCGVARICGMGPRPDAGVPSESWEEYACGMGCRGCSVGDEGRCEAACVAGPIQECINRALSCDAIETCLAK